jgi:hypothetical protein
MNARMARTVSRVALLSAVAGCGNDWIVNVPNDGQSRTVVVSPGQEVRVVLGNVGPAEYESPPRMSSDALTYLGVEVIPPFNPGGPTQRFRFMAVRAGESIIHFRRLDGSTVVSFVDDTIKVR